ANRWGHGQFSAPQLKILQEVITLTVFSAFAILYLKEQLRWNDLAGYACILAAIVFVFAFRSPASSSTTAEAAAPVVPALPTQSAVAPLAAAESPPNPPSAGIANSVQ